ncbi:MAG: NYN domain-containing protein [Gammaproteobacteria bacterium]
MRYAVLIDGGFIKRKLGSRLQPMTISHVSTFLDRLKAHQALKGLRLHRVYWYDALPLQGSAWRPLRGGRVDFAQTAMAQANRKLLSRLCTLPHVSVRRGDLVFRGWKVRSGKLPEREAAVTLVGDDIEPNIQQKGVDMRIGLDIAALTMKRHVEIIVLVAGDSDFVPAMKFARREGAQVFLVTLGHSVRPEMIEHADLALEIRRETWERPKPSTHAA